MCACPLLVQRRGGPVCCTVVCLFHAPHRVVRGGGTVCCTVFQCCKVAVLQCCSVKKTHSTVRAESRAGLYPHPFTHLPVCTALIGPPLVFDHLLFCFFPLFVLQNSFCWTPLPLSFGNHDSSYWERSLFLMGTVVLYRVCSTGLRWI